ncbi:MAG TPA: aspartate carbamoyltransferase regulatory subunit [Bacteroidales bacterium]|nr:aspartate carbamoyltransferase regulatory subunit [Bacteroidales bacterium]HOX78788.1 aspartate carbamoyltransferase regulatory subunit [Bacteroidales bacterium]HPI85758.1 aspartate carbamoyltransferase regulatory subunit [Bacteroidales bacterium]HPM91416.1 aspartate carbamoyltransferase regulatory subunit [Bacteroidales bacterium]
MEEVKTRTELQVSAIENGTVIDHIPPKSVFQVVKMLGMENCKEQVLFGTNLESKKYGRKGIIKVANLFFQSDEINKIALVAPSATLIVIRNYQVVEKRKVEIPDQIFRFVRCFNPNCITNHEKITTKFNVIDKEDLKLECIYCEKVTGKNNLEFI